MSDTTATILVVDDNKENIKLAANYLKEEGFRVAFALNGEKCLSLAREYQYDLVLLDVMMPEMDGFEICRHLKCIPGYRETPIIFLTARTDKESVIQGFEAGGADYVTKPFHGTELILSREKLEEINAQLQKELLAGMQLSDELERSRQELQRANHQLHAMATTDPLTALMNRRRMLDFLDYEQSRARRKKAYYSVVLCDIDHFKQVNDTWGHDIGDEVLKNVALVLGDGIREQDKASRWGGEEFLLLLPETEGEGAVILADKLRLQLQELKTGIDKESSENISITMTFGIAASCGEIDFDETIRRADTALYKGKEAGRNCTVLYDSPEVKGFSSSS